MAREIINVGAVANDGTGDPIRDAYVKINNMTGELYTALGDGSLLSAVISKDGNPADNQLAVWSGDGPLAGTSNLTWDESLLTLTSATPEFRILNTNAVGGGYTNFVVGAAGDLVLSVDPNDVEAGSFFSLFVDGINRFNIDEGNVTTGVGQWRLGNGLSDPAASVRIGNQTLANLGITEPRLIVSFDWPALTYDVNAATELVVAREAGSNISIISSNTGSSNLNFGDEDQEDSGLLSYDHLNDEMQIHAAGSEVVRVGATGISFDNGTTYATYESGLFTPIFADASSAGNEATTTTSTGTYEKFGQMVHVTIFLENIDTTGLTAGNEAWITGLPFTSSAENARYVGNIMSTNVTFTNSLNARLGSPSTAFRLTESTSGGGVVNRLVSDVTSGTADLYIDFVYRAA